MPRPSVIRLCADVKLDVKSTHDSHSYVLKLVIPLSAESIVLLCFLTGACLADSARL